MTPEEIKKIAEAYAEAMCPVGDYCGGVYDEQRNCDLPIYRDDAKSVLEFLTEHFYLVEKGKVEHSRNAIKFLKEVGYQDRLDLLDSLFGTDIRKEEEE